MIVVANTFLLNIFRQIPLFKMNLGVNFIDMKQERVNVKDVFMIKYLNMFGKQILTYGSIGKLIFYQDFSLQSKEFYIFNDETIYGLNYTDDDSKLTPQAYLASIIKEINDKEGIKENTEKIERKKDPDLKLPADQYIQEMIKKRKLENG